MGAYGSMAGESHVGDSEIFNIQGLARPMDGSSMTRKTISVAGISLMAGLAVQVWERLYVPTYLPYLILYLPTYLTFLIRNNHFVSTNSSSV